MTYTSLSAQILDWANRNDARTVAEVPNTIYLAEQELSRAINSVGVEFYVTSNFVANAPTIEKPSNWIRTVTFNYGTGENNNTVNQVFLRTYEYLRNYWPNPVETGPPQYYSDYGFTSFLLAPTPDLDYPFELAYIGLPLPLTVTNQTNWFTNFAPDALFYKCMKVMMTFLKNYSQALYWNDKAQEIIDGINGQDTVRKTDRVYDRNAD